jgi:hypothetical protein
LPVLIIFFLEGLEIAQFFLGLIVFGVLLAGRLLFFIPILISVFMVLFLFLLLLFFRPVVSLLALLQFLL